MAENTPKIKVKTGYSKNIMAHGKCRIVPTGGKYLIQSIYDMTRLDGTCYRTFGSLKLVNKDEVSGIKEEGI